MAQTIIDDSTGIVKFPKKSTAKAALTVSKHWVEEGSLSLPKLVFGEITLSFCWGLSLSIEGYKILWLGNMGLIWFRIKGS